MTGFLCSAPRYKYKGVHFEYGHFGPAKLTADGEPAKRQGNKFYDLFYEWVALPEEEQESYRVGGGCERF
jgi:hypothetical protein